MRAVSKDRLSIARPLSRMAFILACVAQEAIMILDMQRAVLELENRGVVPMEDAVGTHIDCLRGWVWVTEHECTEDFVLKAGESHDVAHIGVAVVQALGPAMIALRGARHA
jgi:hypothetical protein